MKFGLRFPSIKRRLAARLSWKRYLRHSAGLKAPKGFGALTNPKKAVYNYAYNRTSFSVDRLFKGSRRNGKSKDMGFFTSLFVLIIAVVIYEFFIDHWLIIISVCLSIFLIWYLLKRK